MNKQEGCVAPLGSRGAVKRAVPGPIARPVARECALAQSFQPALCRTPLASSLAMGSNAGDSVFPTHKPPQSGVRTVPQYTGIPPSWLDKRPKLPGRNWLIFLGVTSSIAGYYIYDRRKCKEIRKEYVDKVKHLADVPLHSLDFPRKVTVYGTKWPADEDSDRCMRYFRKYVKVRLYYFGLA